MLERPVLPPAVLRALAIVIGGLGLAVATRTGPHDDTFFEFARLLSASDLGSFLRAVAADNQPPAAPLLSYALLRLGVPLEALRLTVGVLLLAVMSWSAFQGLRWLGWESRRAAAASGLFVILAGWSPATAPVLVMLRYASIVLVAWAVAAVAGIAALERGDRRADVRLGVILGTSLLASTTSIVLAGFWILVMAIATRSTRRVALVLSGATPFLLLVVGWTAWAGPEYIANVIGRSTGRPSIRTLIGQTYEQSVWPILGIVSLPTRTVIVLGSLAALSVGYVARLSGRDLRWWIALSGILVSVPAMVLTQVVNGGVAGPTAVLLLVLAMSAMQSDGRRDPVSQGSIIAMFSLSSAALLLYGALGNGILRPYLWDGSGPEAAALVNETLLERPDLQHCVVESGNYSTAFLLSGVAIELGSSDLEACINRSSVVIDVRGDHPAREQEHAALSVLLFQNGFHSVNTTEVGVYSHAGLRDRLGLRNVQDSHLVVTVHLRNLEQ